MQISLQRDKKHKWSMMSSVWTMMSIMLFAVNIVVLFWRFDLRLKKHDTWVDLCEGQECSPHLLSDILCPQKRSDQQDWIMIMLKAQKCLVLCAHKQKAVHKHELLLADWTTSVVNIKICGLQMCADDKQSYMQSMKWKINTLKGKMFFNWHQKRFIKSCPIKLFYD